MYSMIHVLPIGGVAIHSGHAIVVICMRAWEHVYRLPIGGDMLRCGFTNRTTSNQIK